MPSLPSTRIANTQALCLEPGQSEGSRRVLFCSRPKSAFARRFRGGNPWGEDFISTWGSEQPPPGHQPGHLRLQEPILDTTLSLGRAETEGQAPAPEKDRSSALQAATDAHGPPCPPPVDMSIPALRAYHLVVVHYLLWKSYWHWRRFTGAALGVIWFIQFGTQARQKYKNVLRELPGIAWVYSLPFLARDVPAFVFSRVGSPAELQMRSYRGSVWNFDPDPMGHSWALNKRRSLTSLLLVQADLRLWRECCTMDAVFYRAQEELARASCHQLGVEPAMHPLG